MTSHFELDLKRLPLSEAERVDAGDAGVSEIVVVRQPPIKQILASSPIMIQTSEWRTFGFSWFTRASCQLYPLIMYLYNTMNTVYVATMMLIPAKTSIGTGTMVTRITHDWRMNTVYGGH